MVKSGTFLIKFIFYSKKMHMISQVLTPQNLLLLISNLSVLFIDHIAFSWNI